MSYKTQRIVISFAVLIFLLVRFSPAQPLHPDKELSQYSLDRVGVDKIPAGILRMIQTSDGYLWMATFDNLVCFDGVEVTMYDRFTNPEFNINGFRFVFEDRHKNLWAGSNGGGLFLKKEKRFKKFTLPFGPKSNYVETIYNDSKDNLWLGTAKGLALLQKDSTFKLIPPSFQPSKPDYTIFDISEDKKGTLWIASSIGVLKYSDGKLIEHEWPGVSLRGEIMSIHVDSLQNIWIGSYGKGIFKAKADSVTKILEIGSFGRSVAIMEDKRHDIWIGSESGIARYRKGGVSKLGIDDGIANVTTICEDHEGSLWLGTYYSGLSRLRDGTFTNFSRSNGLPNNTVHSIFQTKDSTIWVGTETNFASYKNGKFTKMTFAELTDSRVRDISTDSEGNMWIATYNGLFKIKDKKLTRYSTDKISSERVSAILEDSHKRLWIGTRNGLNLYENGKWKQYADKDGLTNSFIMSLVQLHDGSLVVGTNAGIFRMKGDRFEALATDQGEIMQTVFRTYEDKDGYLWMGTNVGLMAIKNGKLHSFFTEDKYLAGVIFQVLEDHMGMMWLTSNTGIVRVARQELIDRIHSEKSPIHSELFNKSNGMPANGITGASKGMIAFDKKIWFPTLQGVAVVDPADIAYNKVPPPIVIEKILVDGKEFDNKGIINVPALPRNIEIHYTAMSFMAPDKVQFRYLLKGYDKDWYEANDRRTAYFSSLPPGDYTFMLEAKNNDNVWSKKESAVMLHVAKAFWQTWTFYILNFLLAGLIIWAIINYRIRSIKELNKILDEKIKERTKELEKAKSIIAEQYAKLQVVNESLEEKVAERTRALLQALEELDYFVYKSSHDIKGPLARLHGLSNLALMESKEEATRKYLQLLQRESILANRVIQKLSYANQIKNMPIEIAPINLFDLINTSIDWVKLLHPESGNLKFTVDIDKDIVLQSDIKLISELFASVLENAVIFQGEKDQMVRISAFVDNGEVFTSIFDNGIGIDESAKPSLFKMFYKGHGKSVGLGLGLYIARRITEKLYGKIELKHSGQGATEFEIILPEVYRAAQSEVGMLA